MTPPPNPSTRRRGARLIATLLVAVTASALGVAVATAAGDPPPTTSTDPPTTTEPPSTDQATPEPPSTTSAPPTTSPPSSDPQRIEFAPGTDSATLTGRLAPGADAAFLFRASAGQTVYVEIGPTEFVARTFIWGDGELANGGNSVSATLPYTGDYVLGVDNTGTTTMEFTVTVSIPAQTSPPATGECGVDPQAPDIAENIGNVPQGLPGVPWTYRGDSNYDPCADLSYAMLETEMGTASSPEQIMLFHRGDFIGTATECAFAFTSVVDATGNSLTVEYRWPRGDDPNAAPSGSATTTFSWNGSDVVMSTSLPAELLDVSGCSASTPSTTVPTSDGELPVTR